MAVWQFQVYFIPRRSLMEKYGKLPSKLEMDDDAWSNYIQDSDLESKPKFEDALTIPWWLNIKLDINEVFTDLKKFGDLQEWSANVEGLKSYGQPDSNDISACFDSQTNALEDLSCRIDVRKVEQEFIEQVISLALKYDCLLLDKKGNLYEPTNDNIFKAIRISNAKRFANDPGQFLDDLSLGKVKPE